MGLICKTYLTGSRVYACCHCKTHLATGETVISKQFQGQHGRAWLFCRVANVIEGHDQDRTMTTGRHTVRDIMCTHCEQILGWKYVKAHEESQQYKEGNYILERNLLVDV